MKTILITEDDPNQCELYREELTDEGYNVLCAQNGREALQKVRENLPDLVVLDINLPGMDGIEVLSHILGEHPQLPVIIHTAYCAYKDNFMTWAANAYVVKSGDLTELKTRIKQELERQEPEQSTVTVLSAKSSADTTR